ncbi:hypothetical protein OIU77_002083 [Salix suchowensis]|uniref:Hydroxyproline-rich glycoprotein family protein n=1 Tax=Salix suchowensis TaxID=1278906 RepID=A0ABQ9B3M6_9ROSI|nr:hypothetical protein OIU77_002083 [Salix suchowensis]
MATSTSASAPINILVLHLFLLLHLTTSTSTTHHRHLLHQPFFPVTPSIPPTQPPSSSPQPQPKYPFTSDPSSSSSSNNSNPQKPFFPSLPSPPPPPPSTSTLATFPPFFIYSRRKTQPFSPQKSSRSESLRLYPQNTIPSDGSPKPPKLPHRPGVVGVSSSSSSQYQKLGSPELRPLPPLPRHNYTPTYRSGEVLVSSSKEEDEVDRDTDEEEEFFSPRGSSGRKETSHESPVHVDSSSRREIQGTQGESIKRSSPPISSSSSSERDSGELQSSLDRNLGFSGQNEQVPVRIESASKQFVPVKLPPPPPPPPPPRFWEMPTIVRVTPEVNLGSSGPPVLVTPTRSVLVQNLAMPVLANEHMQKQR